MIDIGLEDYPETMYGLPIINFNMTVNTNSQYLYNITASGTAVEGLRDVDIDVKLLLSESHGSNIREIENGNISDFALLLKDVIYKFSTVIIKSYSYSSKQNEIDLQLKPIDMSVICLSIFTTKDGHKVRMLESDYNILKTSIEGIFSSIEDMTLDEIKKIMVVDKL